MIRHFPFAIFIVALSLAACGRPITEPIGELETTEEQQREAEGKLFGEDFLKFEVARRSGVDDGAGAGIGVNAFLWRASLDTLSFLPLSSADPFGGVIITDWYAPPETGNERFKVTVYILDRQLRSDGVRVSVFRQVRDADQGWIDAAVDEDTAIRLEDTILTRARQLRIAQLGN